MEFSFHFPVSNNLRMLMNNRYNLFSLIYFDQYFVINITYFFRIFFAGI